MSRRLPARTLKGDETVKMYLFRYRGQSFLCRGYTERGAQLNLDRIFGKRVVKIEREATVKEKLALHGRVIPHTSPLDQNLGRHVQFMLRAEFIPDWVGTTARMVAVILDPALPVKTEELEGRLEAAEHYMSELPMWDEEVDES